MLKLLLRKFTFSFSPFAVAITLLCLLIYGAGQQIYRTGANDPQIEIANRIVSILNTGMNPAQVVVGQPVDMQTSLAIHASVFDSAGKPVASTTRVNNKIPVPPAGVFEYAKQKGEDVFTWEPYKDVRCAAVALPYGRGTVIVGRSLRIVEQREMKLAEMVLLGWLFTLIAVAVTIVTVIYLQFNVLRNAT